MISPGPAMPNSKALADEAASAHQFAVEVAVEDDQTYSVVGEFVAGLKELRKRIKGLFYDGPSGDKGKGFIPLAKASHQAGLDLYHALDAEAKAAEEVATDKLSGWVEKKRAAAVKEMARIEQERREQTAALDKAGKPEEAKMVALAPPPLVSSAPPPVAGLRVDEGWDFEIVDEQKLPRQYLKPDEKAIKGVVDSLGDKTNIPGVRVFPTTGIKGVGGRKKA